MQELEGGAIEAGDSTAEDNLLGDFDAEGLLGDDMISDAAGSGFGASPSVVLEKPVEDDDADTHFDLGLAYKEMGLYGEAILAFDKVMSAPGREVQCRLMIGLCHREQNNLSEAINQFKAALYVDGIGAAEKFDLYYEIGSTYEGLQDPQEALYYYEMVHKKQPDYRDVAERVAKIKAAVNQAGA
jgi:tetratricopeptide (TPR) repeat protein